MLVGEARNVRLTCELIVVVLEKSLEPVTILFVIVDILSYFYSIFKLKNGSLII